MRILFSALYIKQQIVQAICTNHIPEELFTHMSSIYLRDMLAELCDENDNIDGFSTKTKLHELLDTVRGTHIDKNEYIVNSILMIWEGVSKYRLLGENLRNLDLRHVPLNGVLFTRGSNEVRKKNAAHFSNSIISTCTFLPQGHELDINSASFSNDGELILTASQDGSIKEWRKE